MAELLYKDIVDQITEETQIPTTEYTKESRIRDVMQAELFLLGKAKRFASKYPFILPGETTEETFTAVDGDNTFTRTIQNVLPKRVLYRKAATDDWTCLERQTECPDGCVCYCLDNFKFEINSKEVTVYEARAGFVKVEYQKGAFSHYEVTDYDNGANVDAPSWLDETYRPLLWMRPSIRYAGYFKPERKAQIKEEYNELYADFIDYLTQFTEDIGYIHIDTPNNYR